MHARLITPVQKPAQDGRPESAREALFRQARALFQRGCFAETLILLGGALEGARSRGELDYEGRLQMFMSLADIAMSRTVEASLLLARATQLSADAGEVTQECLARAILASLELLDGRAEAARVGFQRSRSKLENLGHPEEYAVVAALEQQVRAIATAPEGEAMQVDDLPRFDEGSAKLKHYAEDAQCALMCLRRATRGEPFQCHIEVGGDYAWFRIRKNGEAGERIEMTHRPSLRRLLRALSDHHRATQGSHLPGMALFLLAWPGVRIGQGSAMNRVRVGIATLRRLGLEDVITTFPDGYGFDPRVGISFTSESGLVPKGRRVEEP